MTDTETHANTVREALDVLYHYRSDEANPPGAGRSESWGAGLESARWLVARITELEQQLAAYEPIACACVGPATPGGEMCVCERVAYESGNPWMKTLERSEARVAELTKALRFYADPSTYVEGNVPHPREFATYVTPIHEDEGVRARAALAAPEDTRDE